MSYDIYLKDPETGECMELAEPHQMRGGTYPVGGTTQASLNVTYNYAPHFYRVITGGIRALYGMKAADSLPLIASAIAQLKDDVDPDYWKPTEGNARAALMNLLVLGAMLPNAVWDGY